VLLWIVFELGLGLFLWSADKPLNDIENVKPMIGAEQDAAPDARQA